MGVLEPQPAPHGKKPTPPPPPPPKRYGDAIPARRIEISEAVKHATDDVMAWFVIKGNVVDTLALRLKVASFLQVTLDEAKDEKP